MDLLHYGFGSRAARFLQEHLGSPGHPRTPVVALFPAAEAPGQKGTRCQAASPCFTPDKSQLPANTSTESAPALQNYICCLGFFCSVWFVGFVCLFCSCVFVRVFVCLVCFGGFGLVLLFVCLGAACVLFVFIFFLRKYDIYAFLKGHAAHVKITHWGVH